MAKWYKKLKIIHSLQGRLALGYSVIIAALLVLMNTYPLLMSQNLMFRTQQTTLQNQATLLSNTLTTADELTPETVEQAIRPLDRLDDYRVLVTDRDARVLYDNSEESTVGTKIEIAEISAALSLENAFYSDYKNGVFYSQMAVPIMTRNTAVGAVCLFGEDDSQGVLLEGLQYNLRLISGVVCVAVLGMLTIFSKVLTRRLNILLEGFRIVRGGEYTHRIAMQGKDELSQLAQEFNRLTGRLQTTEEERRRFFSDASHELKTPLASIRLLTDSILQDASMNQETVVEFVQDIGEATDRLIAISEALVALNHLDEGIAIHREAIALNEEVEKAGRLLAPLAVKAGVHLKLELGEPCVVCCRQEDVYQICRNLMENAIKYNVPDGSVTVRTYRQEETVCLSVSDTGVGIPTEDIPRIFERFYRVDKARSREAGGTGLGLSIVRDSVRLHSGEISVSAQKTGGVCFLVKLPAWTGEELSFFREEGH